jgi:hypothetical protein
LLTSGVIVWIGVRHSEAPNPRTNAFQLLESRHDVV